MRHEPVQRRRPGDDLLARRAGAALVRPALPRLTELQQRVALLGGRFDHLRLRGLPIDPVTESAAQLLPDVEQLRTEMLPIAAADSSGRVRDVLLASDALLIRLHAILAAETAPPRVR